MKTGGNEKEVLPARALQAREAAGFSILEAAKLLGFRNYQTLSAIEKGSRKIGAHELSAMARLYGRSLDYFFQLEAQADPQPLWRKAVDAVPQEVERQFLLFLENYSKLEELLGLERRWRSIQRKYDRRDFASHGFDLVDQLAVEIRESLNLGSRPAPNLLNVLGNNLRFKILHLPLREGISGASVVDEKVGVGVLINERDVPWRRNFDLAHELFHIITWGVFPHYEVGDGKTKTKPEQYADAFASSLLLPKDDLLKSLEEITTGNQMRYVDIIELAKNYGVSTEAVLWRLVNLGKVDRSEVEKAKNNPELTKIDRTRRRGLFGSVIASKFPSRYISLACRCLIEGKISRGVFAKYLAIDRDDVDTTLRKHGYLDGTYEKVASA